MEYWIWIWGNYIAWNGIHLTLIVLKFSRHCNPIYHSIDMHNFVLRGTNPTHDHVKVRGRNTGVKGRIGEGMLAIFSYRIAIGKIWCEPYGCSNTCIANQSLSKWSHECGNQWMTGTQIYWVYLQIAPLTVTVKFICRCVLNIQ